MEAMYDRRSAVDGCNASRYKSAGKHGWDLPLHCLVFSGPPRLATMNLRDNLFLFRTRLKYLSSIRRRVLADSPYKQHVYVPQHNLVYFSTPKAACTSIKSLLGELLSFPADQSPHDHPFPKLAPEDFLEKLQVVHSFAVVREPVSRLVSGYKSMVLRPVHDQHYFHGVFRPLVKYGGFQHAMSFEDFCQRVVQIPDRAADPHFRSQTVCVSDPNHGCLPSHLFRFDTMMDEIPVFLAEITNQEITLLKRNYTTDMSVNTELSAKCYAQIRRRYEADFSLYEGIYPLKKSA